MSYKGKYKIKHPEKYLGDYTKVVYRSLWERQAFKWCEGNSRVRAWNSEEVVIPYKCKTDNRIHRYFIDLFIEMDDGKCILVEIKPKKQTVEPKVQKRKTKAYIYEVTEYAKNMAKWRAAEEFCKDRMWEFKVLTEDELGIR